MSATLKSYNPGQKGTIKHIVPNELTPKLVEMGMHSGVHITMLYAAPMGDPIAVDVGGYMLSLRLDEAELVIMENESK
jgi:ferrous iron transport protein A